MCGPYAYAAPAETPQPTEERAIRAYRAAMEEITAANYEGARLHLDLAHRGLARISDHIALRSARLELLRGQPDRAIEFFEEAAQSPHESLRVSASTGRVIALLRANDAGANQALEELLRTYPSVPNRSELLFEHAQHLLRQGRYDEAIAAMHAVRIDHPGTRIAPWAESEITRLATLGHESPTITDEEHIRRARRLVRTGPLPVAKTTIADLLDTPLTGSQHAEVHYLAGRLARNEGRWKAAETYLRTAQLFPIEDAATARHIEHRANEMAETAGARDPGQALRTLTRMRAGRANASISSNQLIDLLRVASAAGLTEEANGILATLTTRAGTPSAVLFEAAMAGDVDVEIPGAAEESHLLLISLAIEGVDAGAKVALDRPFPQILLFGDNDLQREAVCVDGEDSLDPDEEDVSFALTEHVHVRRAALVAEGEDGLEILTLALDLIESYRPEADFAAPQRILGTDGVAALLSNPISEGAP